MIYKQDSFGPEKNHFMIYKQPTKALGIHHHTSSRNHILNLGNLKEEVSQYFSPESCRHCPGASGGDCNGDQFGMKNVSIIETMFLQWFFYQGTCWGSTWPYRWWVLATEEFAVLF
ncbi:hypothetical protein Y1Q_0021731 [Alligator mississippiensis]|uniref:Uncharacterized protein n=1 Tax=Alligator mississippiensis TaxID=8496 RepID=A0A151PAX0_ALLMI|nr:hypothetical protein Y1Q_0021731 [Alligator mississippiensis]